MLPTKKQLFICLSSLLLPLLLFSGVVVIATELPSSSSSPSLKNEVDITNGHSNLLEGQRLFYQNQYISATPYLWRAVLLHPTQQTHKKPLPDYEVEEAFSLFLKCYTHLNRIVDGFVFVAAESYLRGQEAMGELYLSEALKLQQQQQQQDNSDDHVWATKLQSIVSAQNLQSVVTLAWIKEVRDAVDVARNSNGDGNDDDDDTMKKVENNISDQYQVDSSTNNTNNNNTNNNNILILSQKYQNNTPEEIYNIGTHYFNMNNLQITFHPSLIHNPVCDLIHDGFWY